jgi:uroporphyrinogen decarboxylase
MIHEMFSAASRLVLAALGPILGRVRVDFAYFCEDLAFKNGTLVSPRMYAEFWSPYQRPIIERLREHGVPVIAHWSSGQLEPLLPELLAQGFNCIGPVERLAGMDAADLRRRYGKDLLMIGNIAKEALLAGPAEIDREIERLGPLIRQGGFLPNLDDMTPMECPLSHYRHLIRRLRG